MKKYKFVAGALTISQAPDFLCLHKRLEPTNVTYVRSNTDWLDAGTLAEGGFTLNSKLSVGQRNNTPPSKAKKRNRKGVRINFRLFTLFGNLPGLYKL